MRVALVVLIGMIWCPLAVGEEDSPTPKPLKVMGDETLLVKVKVEPQAFSGKPFVMTGGVQVDDYYNAECFIRCAFAEQVREAWDRCRW
jgi:hypothetical protein